MLATLRQFGQEFTLLSGSTLLTALLLIPLLGLMSLDSRIVVGANAWLKPLKFAVSIVIFNLTVGWLLRRLALPPSSARAIGWAVAVAMGVEISAIVLQAARGVPSHYNVSTSLNAAIFSAMAVAIVVNTLAIAWLCLLSFQPQHQLPPAVAWGIRLGLILFLLSSLQGFGMVANRGHTVGASDGGPGLPILHWSTRAGDLRMAHFLGLHGPQILPFLGYLLSRTHRQSGTPVVAAAFTLLAALFLWSLCQARAGRPLLR